MLPLLIAIPLALGFALLVAAIYGPAALSDHLWVMLTLWGLVNGATMVAMVGREPPAPRGRPTDLLRPAAH